MSNADLLAELKIDRNDQAGDDGRSLTWLWVLIVVLLAAAAAWYFMRPQAPEVTIATARTAPSGVQASSVLDASGYVTARRIATVSSKVTGKVNEVLIEEGMQVTEGQVLARLDDSSERADYRLAKAQEEAARVRLNELSVQLIEAEKALRRTQDLQSKQLASASDLDAAVSRAETLKARLASGKEDVAVASEAVAVQQRRLDDMVIRAPFEGVVIAKAAQPGEMISPISAGSGFTRTGIGTIVDMQSLEIEVDVNEAYIQRVETGQRVTATLDAYPDWKIGASVIAIIPTADRQKATVRVRIGFDQLDSRILPDMGVKVAFHSDQPASDVTPAAPAVLIPADALRRDGSQDIVFVVRDDTATRQAVRTDGRVGEQVRIVAGLRAGESVIVAGPEDLQEGMAVKVP